MEAITYDRAQAFKDEFPKSEYDTWQPKKIMSVLLEIEPTTDRDSSLAYGIEDESGVPTTKMKALGSEVVLNMATIRKHYDALGSYLHIPTIKSAVRGKQVDPERLRERCDEIKCYLEKVLSSPVFNITLGTFSTLECMECGNKLRKRIPHGAGTFDVECFSCDASYSVNYIDDGSATWNPKQQEIKCANQKCGKTIVVWERELCLGRHWHCSECNGDNTITLGLSWEASA